MDVESESIEIQAADVETAIAKGLAQLSVSRDQVRVKVVEEGSRGMLGLGARDAVVRLTLRTLPAVEAEAAGRPQKPEVPREAEESERAEPQVTESPPAGSVTAVVAREVLRELLDLMGIEAQVELRDEQDMPTGEDAPPFILDVLGDDLGILIGRRGKTLYSLQFITRLIVSREVGEWVKLVVDVEKYKVRRAKKLEERANRLAERVVLTQQPIALEPMPPNERRVIHVTLQDHPIVTTESVGKGNRRKVTIIPRS